MNFQRENELLLRLSRRLPGRECKVRTDLDLSNMYLGFFKNKSDRKFCFLEFVNNVFFRARILKLNKMRCEITRNASVWLYIVQQGTMFHTSVACLHKSIAAKNRIFLEFLSNCSSKVVLCLAILKNQRMIIFF